MMPRSVARGMTGLALPACVVCRESIASQRCIVMLTYGLIAPRDS